jgi:uncharacterized tellurite resistance protein B-like protein
MWAKLKTLFEDINPDEGLRSDEDKKRLASAALLVEVATIDDNFDQFEMHVLQKHLVEQYDLSAEFAQELCEHATNEHRKATSLFEFTSLINKHCTHDDKFDLVKAMWAVAFADGNIDKYEEYIIRRAAELIYVSHGDFVRAKHLARESIAPNA